MQHKLLNLCLFTVFIGAGVVLLSSLVVTLPAVGWLLIVVEMVISLISLFIANKLYQPQLGALLIILSTNLILIPMLFFVCGGLHSAMMLWMNMTLVLPLLLLKGKKIVLVFAFNAIVLITTIFMSVKYPFAVVTEQSDSVMALDVAIGLVVVSVIFAVVFNFQTRVFETQRKQMFEAMAQAQKAAKAKSEFLSNMSHDIRTPMNAIVGYTEIAKKNSDDRKKLMDCFSKISISSNHLLKLINDVLDMSKIESGRMVIDEEVCNLRALVRNVCDIMQHDIDEKKLKINIDTRGLVDDTVSCDRLRVNQVLLNIVGNAIKYANDGGNIFITVNQLPSTDDSIIECEIKVRDEGCGMSQEFLEKIFEPFERGKSTTLSGVPGSGLGLTITKSLVLMMSGRIDIQSELYKGTEVTINLPFHVPTMLEIDDDEAVEDSFDFKGKRILVVEDNAMNREIAVEILTDSGFLVEEAIDGTFAIEMISVAAPGYYDLVLMDLQMPIMDGYEATRIIRSFENKELADIPIIAMTANAFDEDRKKAFNSGMNAYLTKPVSVPELLKILNVIVKEGEHQNKD